MPKLLTASIIAAGASAASMIFKDKNIAPVNRAINSVKLNIPVMPDYNNSIATTPPMGWSSWNLFRNKINEELIYSTAKAMKDSGLADCGYQYVNLDDCWQSSFRDENGRLQGDFVAFPNGIKSLADKVNALGLKLGIYSSNGTLTCEDLPASLGHEAVDADTFAEWGIEYFKYDFCHNVQIPSKAPIIEKITVSKIGLKEEKEYLAKTAILTGDAKIIDDASLPSGKCITGLSSNGGACEFANVTVENDGDYILTLCIRKKNLSNKYVEILVNRKLIYKTTIPGTKSFTPEGRHQIKIKLNAGVNTIKIYNPVASRRDSAAIQYMNMGKELKRATREYAQKNGVEEKPIVFSICEWGRNFPWQWGAQAGNLWRTTPDIRPVWSSVVGIYEFNVLLDKHARVGAWNDPDMLEVGNGSLTYDENKSHFTLWCMMAAPLILGNDIRDFILSDGSVDYDNRAYQILTNKDVIAIDQDPLGVQCKRIRTNGAEDILVKPLADGGFALCFFNKANSSTVMKCTISEVLSRDLITTSASERYSVKELWSGDVFETADVIESEVNAHGVRIYKVRAV